MFFFKDTPTTEIYTLSLHDALPISKDAIQFRRLFGEYHHERAARSGRPLRAPDQALESEDEGIHLRRAQRDRKSTRLNSSHTVISYAVFCLKKKIKNKKIYITLYII